MAVGDPADCREPRGRLSPARLLRDNGLTLALLAIFLLTAGGMALAGWQAHNAELAEHGAPPATLVAFLRSGTFLSALFENWESEFLQMSFYVALTAFLFQRGSAESRDPDEAKPTPRPAPFGRGSPLARLASWLYGYSLGLALAILFVLTFVAHLLSSAQAANEEALLHGGVTGAWQAHLGDARFWFESLQNWQSEFLSTAVLVVLSIFLRFHGSPESKKVDAPHGKTGG